MKKTWQIHSPDADQISLLVSSLKCQRAIATVLVNRGLTLPEQARRFLHPSVAQIRSPFLMKDMEVAVSRVIRSIQNGEKILVFGDYDADGITGTALLADFFSSLNIAIEYHIPNRLTEGYGLTPEAVQRYAVARDIDLIITVDCGIGSHEAVETARKAGIDVIITDHHQVPERLPDALAIINPKRPDCPSPFSWLAGVGVAFNLVLALRKNLREAGFWENHKEPNLKAACDLVALGTVADMVPLVEENRIFVREGLQILSECPRPGLKALLDVAGGPTNGALDAWDLAFKLAPRLNAAGRLGSGRIGCELLTTSNEQVARRISQELDSWNTTRKDIENRMLSDVVELLEENPGLAENAIVLDAPHWHEGVVGVVASRLVRRYLRPVVLIAVRDGLGKGSARGPEGFDLYEALQACSGVLDRFGGHKGAAGLSLTVENIPAFRSMFHRIAAEKLCEKDLTPALYIDTEIVPEEICPGLLNDLERLAPFGQGNPEPLFVLSDLHVLSAQTVGNTHVKMRLIPKAGNRSSPLECIFFDAPFQGDTPRHLDRVACHVRWNRWMDRQLPQLVIKDFA